MESTDFYNSIVDDLMLQNNSIEESQSQQAPEEESEFITGLRAYDDEQKSSNSSNDPDELYTRLENLINTKLSDFSMKQLEYDWFANDDGEDYLTDMYNTQSGQTPYDPSSTPIQEFTGVLKASGSLKENIAQGESGGDYFIQNPQAGQSAFGKYQFTNDAQKDAYNSTGGASKYGSFANYQKAFRSDPNFQEEAMTARMQQAEKAVGKSPIAQALYHYAPKFGIMYSKGQLDLNKKPSDYGVGKGVKNPTFKQFLISHNITE